MKKSVLALSIATAVGGLGFAGSAFAVTDAPNGGLATKMIPAEAGIGKVLVVPYYTAQTEHATLINIVNNDTVNGKALKVRFRGAANSDDVYDFQLFLSPGDVWAANVSQDATTKLARLTTNDSSCTKPASVNGTFVTQRLRAAWSAEKKAENTREGYVEILNMGDVPPSRAAIAGETGSTINGLPDQVTNELYTAIKHVKGATPPCSGTTWTTLDKDRATADYVTPAKTGIMAYPTGGLMGDWTIINVNNASAWGSTTPAFRAVDGRGNGRRGNLVYFPQTAGDLPNPTTYTADPLFTGGTTSVPALKAQYYDVPDLSTPYTSALTSTSGQALQYTQALEVSAIKNEYLTDPSVSATTDWVVSMPSRRYAVAVNYEAKDGSGVNKPVVLYNGTAVSYFSPDSTTLVNDQVCIKNIKPVAWDRSEQFTDSPTEVVISPNPLPQAVVFCGEASILTVNNPGATQTGVLNGTVAFKDIATNGWADGWIDLATPGATAGYGLPVLGGAFVRATSGASTFGANWDHRYVRPDTTTIIQRIQQIPDVTPVITASPNVLWGKIDFSFTIRVTELNNVATRGAIVVRIPKDVHWNLDGAYDPSLTMIGITPLNNSAWTYSEDTYNHIFTSSTVIDGRTNSTFGFAASWDSYGESGNYNPFAYIDSGSGGEVRIDNNSDTERIMYFAN
jgi:hypothetical protein